MVGVSFQTVFAGRGQHVKAFSCYFNSTWQLPHTLSLGWADRFQWVQAQSPGTHLPLLFHKTDSQRGGVLPYSGRDCAFHKMAVHEVFQLLLLWLPSYETFALKHRTKKCCPGKHKFNLQIQYVRILGGGRRAWKVKRMLLFTLPCVMHECRRRAYFGYWRAPWFCQSVQSSSFPSGEKWSPFLCITDGYWNCTGQQAVPEKHKHTKTKISHLSTLGINLFRHTCMKIMATLC